MLARLVWLCGLCDVAMVMLVPAADAAPSRQVNTSTHSSQPPAEAAAPLAPSPKWCLTCPGQSREEGGRQAGRVGGGANGAAAGDHLWGRGRGPGSGRRGQGGAAYAAATRAVGMFGMCVQGCAGVCGCLHVHVCVHKCMSMAGLSQLSAACACCRPVPAIASQLVHNMNVDWSLWPCMCGDNGNAGA